MAMRTLLCASVPLLILWLSSCLDPIHAFQPNKHITRPASFGSIHETKQFTYLRSLQQSLTVRNRISVVPVAKASRLHSQQGYDGDMECELYEMGYSGEGIRLPEPTPDLSAEDVVQICMDCLLSNDEPKANAGLEVCFNFSSDRCRAALGGSLEEFIAYASNPTFGSMINANEWTKAKVGPFIAGTNTRGAMQTVLVDLKPASGRDRRFLWTMQQEHRPPRQGCWLVHECIYVENAYSLTL